MGAQRFESRRVDVRVASAVAASLWRRARQFSVAEGGRFECCANSIISIIHSPRASAGVEALRF
ncbi:MAG: hypothetical protein HY329_02325 [Chloroflexi bacterium]|nr:hypothetical protein [Chloroflexota bacterium]